MPYALVFGFEVTILLEVGLSIIQTEAYDTSHNKEVLARDLDFIDERRENALIWMADYQQVAKTYNQKVQRKHFSVRDLILRKVFKNTKKQAYEKLNLDWEGPYMIVKLVGKGAYYLEDPKANKLRNLGIPTTWKNITR